MMLIMLMLCALQQIEEANTALMRKFLTETSNME